MLHYRLGTEEGSGLRDPAVVLVSVGELRVLNAFPLFADNISGQVALLCPQSEALAEC